MPAAQEYSVTREVLEGIPVKCTVYRVGDVYHCTVSNESPGANVAKATGPTRDQAVNSAMEKARTRFTRGR